VCAGGCPGRLGRRVDAGQLGEVDQQPQLDAVAGDERHLLQQLLSPGVLTGQGLDEAREPRPQGVQQRAGNRSVTRPPPVGTIPSVVVSGRS
jgi:hypothetical protein